MNCPKDPASLARQIGLFLSGIAIGGCGVAGVVYCYAFASMVDPNLGPFDRVAKILGKMFLSPLVVVVMFSSVFLCAGLSICVWTISCQAFAWPISSWSLLSMVGTVLLLVASMLVVLVLL